MSTFYYEHGHIQQPGVYLPSLIYVQYNFEKLFSLVTSNNCPPFPELVVC